MVDLELDNGCMSDVYVTQTKEVSVMLLFVDYYSSTRIL